MWDFPFSFPLRFCVFARFIFLRFLSTFKMTRESFFFHLPSSVFRPFIQHSQLPSFPTSILPDSQAYLTRFLFLASNYLRLRDFARFIFLRFFSTFKMTRECFFSIFRLLSSVLSFNILTSRLPSFPTSKLPSLGSYSSLSVFAGFWRLTLRVR